MNNVFTIKRFGALLLKECREFPANFGLTVLSMNGIYVVFLLASLLSSSSPGVFSRLTFIVFMTVMALVFSPSKLYGTVNHKKKGLHYAQLPASVLEKTLSMFVVRFVCVALSMLVSLFVVDTLFYLLFPSYTSGFLFANSWEGVFSGKVFFDMFLIQSLFVLGNMVFKRQKVAKTFAVLMGFALLLSIVAGLVIKSIGIEAVERFVEILLDNFPQELENSDWRGMGSLSSLLSQNSFVRALVIGKYSIGGLVTASCWFGTYRLIKTTKY